MWGLVHGLRSTKVKFCECGRGTAQSKRRIDGVTTTMSVSDHSDDVWASVNDNDDNVHDDDAQPR